MSWEEILAASSRCPQVGVGEVLATVLRWPGLQNGGVWAEFGVWKGNTLRALVATGTGARVFGFDSFRGLPEDWRPDHAAGKFALDEPPDVPGAELVVGRFEDTLPGFRWPGPVTLLHVDCDLYRSARCVLEQVTPHLAPGAVVVFDELFDYPGHEAHELRALHEAYDAGMRFRWLARSVQESAAIVVSAKSI